MTKNKITIAVLFSFVLTSYAQAQSLDTLVVGGTPTPAHSAASKAMMMLRINNSTCSGVAITREHVLTAGHCIQKKPAASSIKVFNGSKKIAQAPVKYYFLHPGYGWESSRIKGDLAILKMSKPFTADVVPAPLFKSSIPDYAQLVAAGFGWSDSGKTRTRELYQAIYVWDRTAFFDRRPFSDGTRLIEYTSRQALCNGDSGGATMIATSNGLRTVGIHSMANCVNSGFDVYAPDHQNWIGQVLSYK